MIERLLRTEINDLGDITYPEINKLLIRVISLTIIFLVIVTIAVLAGMV